MKISRCNCINLPACFFEPNILISLTHDDIIKIETFSALLAICVGNSPVPGEFPTQRPVTRSFDVFFDLRLNKRLSTQLWGWWFETLTRSLWRHCNAFLQNTHNNYPVPMFISRIGTHLKKQQHRNKWQFHCMWSQIILTVSKIRKNIYRSNILRELLSNCSLPLDIGCSLWTGLYIQKLIIIYWHLFDTISFRIFATSNIDLDVSILHKIYSKQMIWIHIKGQCLC